MARKIVGVSLYFIATFLLYAAYATVFFFPGELAGKVGPSLGLLLGSLFVFWCWYRVDFGPWKVAPESVARPDFQEVATRFLILLVVCAVLLAGIVATISSLHVRFG
jgi:hypothetical protein